ncbi:MULTISPECIES: amino acid permease [unclassified Gemella]|uniref:amino acid permease n=1 Tax=unclassified Gemella TaxID=2624949 RepID=UPI0015D07A9B|nr:MULTISPECIES: amino acid permease [unclassified Gemella]MBF0710077.1 amino acid permease [Gemella sp. GL1.1]MBF0746156.1 amino acid permease [Gemella sp. 19428wG2_WT2a]NYS27421.1 amino acid permease [Gemella sp. GL1]
MSKENRVQRKLKSRHITMIAIGGCIGSGLFMTSGQAISNAGPGGALLAYLLIGLMVYFLMTSLGEMATYLPTSGSFSTYASRYVDPSLGFALGWNYWFNWVITVAVDIELSALAVSYWEPMRILPAWVWSMIFLLIIIGLNSLSVQVYGESEYWFALIKVVTVIVFLVIGCLTIFGILGGPFIGLENLTVGEAPFIGEDSSLSSKILAAIGVFLIAGYSFQGTELIGVTAGESENPERAIPKAVKQVFWRILIFYVLAIIVIGLLIPYTSEDLMGAASAEEIAKSPFTIVFQNAGFAFAASVMNAVILTSILSAGNSGMFASTRMLYAMSKENQAFPIFSKLNKNGTPINSLIATTLVIVTVLLIQKTSDGAYTYIVAASGLTGFIAWLGIAISHYRFRRAYIKQGKDLNELKYKAKWFPVGPILALILCIIVIVGQDTQLITKGVVDWGAIVTTYMGIPVFLFFYLYHKIKYKTKLIPLEKVDLSKNID